jgi:hypothetical protein
LHEVLQLSPHHGRSAHLPTQDRFVQEGQQFRRFRGIKQLLALHAQLDATVDVLSSCLRVPHAGNRPRVLRRLQQSGHESRLEGLD